MTESMIQIDRLNELRERVEKATGASLELDARIRAAFFAPEDAYAEQSEINGAWVVYRGERNGRPKLYEPSYDLPYALWRGAYTASTDAALSLAERVLPGWHWAVGHDARGEIYASVWNGTDEFEAYGANASLSIVEAVLLALSHTQEPDNDDQH